MCLKKLFVCAVTVTLAFVCTVHAADKKVLVYTKYGKGFVHNCVQACADAVKELGKENGFGVDVSDDPSKFTEANLKQYNALVFDNTNNKLFDTEEQKTALQKYIRAGGGFVGIHSASGGERDWPWYWALVGGKFKSHSPHQTFKMKVVDHNHPSTSFLGDTWDWTDECYFHTNVNPDIHVLIEVDVTALKGGKKNVDMVKVAGTKVAPMTWCHKFDGGREWFVALGHDPKHYSDPNFRKHLLGGIRWVMGEDKK
ncbi:MAG: ThuA domain-containing protein [Kiritimatiellae bacterium]|nr:ThuA domain-containing protein [Kiritimatiellia bacterium]MDD5522892.1 ThuA domain-containing protein [Kiritimatiellia bacterium]